MNTIDPDIDRKAQALWDAMPVSKPSWDQLGEVTKEVWREKVLAGRVPADYLAPSRKTQATESSAATATAEFR